MPSNTKIFKLKGEVQHYDWGGYNFIPSLLNRKNNEHKPYAEYWMGAHSSASSEIEVAGHYENLNQLIKKEPRLYLGEITFQKFGELPFLFKLLDVKEMLSIQVHPTKGAAAKGFELEESAGIAISNPKRNYKDKNHKPEVMVALSDFWLLHGFKVAEELKKVLRLIPEFSLFLQLFNEQGYYGLYKEVMEMPQDKVDAVLEPLVKESISQISPSREEPAYWVKRWYQNKEVKEIDRGVFSIYFLNIVKLLPGEGIFQAANIPHAYLEGQNVELMANSDNVLRGGLTKKHIDVKELLKHTLFESVLPKVMQGDTTDRMEWNYPCPVDDFALSAFQLKCGQQYVSTSWAAEIYIIISGRIAVGTNDVFFKGESFYILPGTEYAVVAQTDCLLYKAHVPR